MLVAGWVQAHGGISALDGLLEAMIILALLFGMGLVWLIFVIYFMVADGIKQTAFNRFRVILYVMASLVASTVLWLLSQDGMNRESLRMLYFFILITVLMTEVTVWLARKSKDKHAP